MSHRLKTEHLLNASIERLLGRPRKRWEDNIMIVIGRYIVRTGGGRRLCPVVRFIYGWY
jgi:hypothetical protein